MDDAAEPGDEEVAPSAEAGAAAAPLSVIEQLRRKGFGRLLVDGQAVSFDDLPADVLKGRTSIGVVVDRLRVEGEMRSRTTDSIEISYQEGGGAAWAVQLSADGGAPVRHEFSERFECRTCRITYEDPQPRLFSFNNPFGACPTCHGFGNIDRAGPGPGRARPAKSINQGAIEPWTKPHYRSQPGRAEADGQGARRPARRAVAGSVGEPNAA